MSKEALSEHIFIGKYAQWNHVENRRETKAEASRRMFDMHRDHYEETLHWDKEELAFHLEDNFYKYYNVDNVDTALSLSLSDLINEAEQSFVNEEVLGSQRALQYGGVPCERQNARVFNCVASYIDRARVFQEAFYLLLCGSGTGIDVQWEHIKKLPAITTPQGELMEHVVADSIEGWADALGALISSYCKHGKEAPFPEYAGKRVVFNLDSIRPEGASLSTGVGKAPGPEPLREALSSIKGVLDTVCVKNKQPFSGPVQAMELYAESKMQPIDAYDIIMHASDAVLAGGVRRSACICFFSIDDTAMMRAKTGNWRDVTPWRGRSNNSAVCVRGKTTIEQFDKLFTSVKEFGEPGFYWVDRVGEMSNPCVEIGFFPQLADGRTGWQFCNLTTTNIRACVDEETFLRACRAAAIIGTLQAGYTSFPYLGEVSEELTRSEALLGVSMTGIAERPEIGFNAELLARGAEVVKQTNELVSLLIKVKPAARTTCVKPEGTSSVYLGTSSGIHGHHAKRYLRRVQHNHMEPQLIAYAAANPVAIEPSVWDKNGSDQVISFCIEPEEGTLTRRELNGLALLDKVILVKKNWVDNGKVIERCRIPSLSHNVSNTINVKDDEWDGMRDGIFDNQDDLSGISLLSYAGDIDYPQAPWCEVFSEEDIVTKYGAGALMASGLIVDGLRVFGGDLWAATDVVLGRGEDLEEQRAESDLAKMQSLLASNGNEDLIGEELGLVESDAHGLRHKEDWVRRAKQFADRYFSDAKSMTECLKHVYNLKLWKDIKRTHIPVDYTKMDDDAANVKISETVACGGGACEVL